MTAQSWTHLKILGHEWQVKDVTFYSSAPTLALSEKSIVNTESNREGHMETPWGEKNPSEAVTRTATFAHTNSLCLQITFLGKMSSCDTGGARKGKGNPKPVLFVMFLQTYRCLLTRNCVSAPAPRTLCLLSHNHLTQTHGRHPLHSLQIRKQAQAHHIFCQAPKTPASISPWSHQTDAWLSGDAGFPAQLHPCSYSRKTKVGTAVLSDTWKQTWPGCHLPRTIS